MNERRWKQDKVVSQLIICKVFLCYTGQTYSFALGVHYAPNPPIFAVTESVVTDLKCYHITTEAEKLYGNSFILTFL